MTAIKLKKILSNSLHIYLDASPAYRIYKAPFKFLFKPLYRLSGLLFLFTEKNSTHSEPPVENFILESKNQYRAMKGLQKHLGINYSYIDLNSFIGNDKNLRYLFISYYLILSPIYLLFLPFIFFRNLQEKLIKFLMVISVFFSIFYTKFFFKKIRSVTFANDHSFLLRSLAEGFFASGKEVVYVQHGSIGEHFPPLSCYNTCYLDGKNTLKIYKNIANFNKNTKINLVGPVRLLSYVKNNNCKEGIYIGVLPSLRDDPADVEISIKKIINNSKYKIKVKLHPRDDVKRYSDLVQKNLCKSESIEQFLMQCQCVISGASGAIIDAAYLGIPVISMHGLFKQKSPYHWVADFPFLKNIGLNDTDKVKKMQLQYVIDWCL